MQRPATLRGIVVDDQGRPLHGARISGISMWLDRRMSTPQPRDFTAQANDAGEFALANIDPREPMRLRVTAKEGSKVVTIAKPGAEGVRIVIAAGAVSPRAVVVSLSGPLRSRGLRMNSMCHPLVTSF